MEDTTLVPADKSSGNCANGSAFIGGGANVVYVGRVMSADVSTGTEESTNDALNRDSGSLVVTVDVVLGAGP